MIQISFRTQDPNIRQAQSGIRVKKLRLIHDPLGLQNPQIHLIYHTNPQSVLFFKARSANPKTYSPPSAIDYKTSRIPTVKNYVSRSREDDFIPHPASNFLCIPHPASILSPIPHPTKPMLAWVHCFCCLFFC